MLLDLEDISCETDREAASTPVDVNPLVLYGADELAKEDDFDFESLPAVLALPAERDNKTYEVFTIASVADTVACIDVEDVQLNQLELASELL